VTWAQFSKGQEVRFRALGGWLRGHVSEVYDNSVSVAFNRGSQVLNIRVYDQRNIEPWQSAKSSPSTCQDNPSFDF
jgi:hypothetical protein